MYYDLSEFDFEIISSITKKSNGLCRWFTNIDYPGRHPKINDGKEFHSGFCYFGHEEMYPKYDNYDAIEISEVKMIPGDYFGVMGVPITYLDKHIPDWFEIMDANDYRISNSPKIKKDTAGVAHHITIKGIPIYRRVLIRRLSTNIEKIA